jgi:ABC-type Fe3+ transport system substrate-binding protein
MSELLSPFQTQDILDQKIQGKIVIYSDFTSDQLQALIALSEELMEQDADEKNKDVYMGIIGDCEYTLERRKAE